MKFCTVFKLPEATIELTTPPTQLIRSTIEREGGQVEAMYGRNGGWDITCFYDCQSPEAQVQAIVALKRVGFKTETCDLVAPEVLDTAWENAAKHPATVGARTR